MENFFNNKLTKLLVALLSVFLLVLIVSEVFEIKKTANEGRLQKDTLTISATAEVDAIPDLATASFAVVTEGLSPEAVQEENTKKINRVIDFLKSEGIDEEDIKTQNYSLFPRYKYDEGEQTLTGYSLNQTVTVKMRDLDNVGKIVAGVVDSGANTVSSLSFSIEDPDELQQEARKQALEKAKDKAKELADVAGVKLGKVVTFNESSVSFPPYYPLPYFAETRDAIGIGGGGAPNIQPGSTTVSATVSVTFELK